MKSLLDLVKDKGPAKAGSESEYGGAGDAAIDELAGIVGVSAKDLGAFRRAFRAAASACGGSTKEK